MCHVDAQPGVLRFVDYRLRRCIEAETGYY
jgi:hypothetical protein